ncbi:histidine phosphatase superfamily [Aspergillus ambiguus]|uniref:acid phosphatase DET1 n=1 Tax=Aspergillus ambiguus TaxID=176160 RepID=UPI003CCDB38A
MGKPRMIILIRHAQSEGNKNREIHQTIPDHRVKLTAEGHRQAFEAGSRLRDLLRPDDTIHFFTSPYRRTRETTEGVLKSLTSDSPAPSPFPRHTIKVYEEPRLREQDFGNFQPCSAEMERMWLERADYGHFFYRIPNGESAADAYDRISGFNESLWRLFGEDDFASVCVLVTHGLMTRVFLMKWYHWSVEYFEDLRNINHCEFVIMKLNPDNGKYVLQNQLRTWSELRREKALEMQRDQKAKGLNPLPLTPSDAPPIRRKWGGCPDGCNHGIRRKGSVRTSRTTTTESHRHGHKATDVAPSEHPPQRDNAKGSSDAAAKRPPTATVQEILTAPEPALGDRTKETKPMQTTIPSPRPQYTFLGLDANTNVQNTEATPSAHAHAAAHPNTNRHDSPLVAPSSIPRRPDLTRFHRDSEDHLLHPPRSNYGLFHLGGRDGGGSMSGANSLAPSEDEHEIAARPDPRPALHHSKPSQDLGNDGDDEGSGTQAQRLRRSRSHHRHHRHNHIHGTVRRNLAKRATGGTEREPDEGVPVNPEDWAHHECEHGHGHRGDDDDDDEGAGDPELEAQRREDQSIRGSVY